MQCSVFLAIITHKTSTVVAIKTYWTHQFIAYENASISALEVTSYDVLVNIYLINTADPHF